MTTNGTLDLRGTSVVAIGFQLWFFVCLAFVGTTLLFPYPMLRIAALLLWAVPVMLWALLRARGPFDVLDLAILMGIVAHLIVSPFSLDKEGSFEASAIVVVYAAAYWLARRVGSDPMLRRMAVVAVVMALMFWLIVIAITWLTEKVVDVQTFGWPPRLNANQAYAWGSVNTPPMLILLVTPFLVSLPSGAFRRLLIVILAVVAVVVIPFSVGRAAWLGIAVAVITVEPLFGFPSVKRVVRTVRRDGAPGWPLAGGLGALITAAAVLVFTRLGDLAAALDSRFRLWQQAMGLFASDPITGSGPSTYPWARLAHAPDFTERVGVRTAHNVPIQTFADGGILLGIALLCVVAAWTWTVVRGRDRLDRDRRVGIATLSGFAAFSLFDDLSFLPAVTVIVILLAAWALPPSHDAPTDRPQLTSRLGLLVPVVLGMGAVLTFPIAASMGTMRVDLVDARKAAVEGEWEDALQGFARAAEAQPDNALHWMSVGLAEFHVGRNRAAWDAYERASRVNPGDPRPWGAMAALSVTGEAERELLDEAARRSVDPQYAFRLASALQHAGEPVAALEYFAIAVVIRPGLLAGLPADLHSGFRERLSGAVMAAGSLAPGNPHEVEWNASLIAGGVHPDAPIQWLVADRVAAGDQPGVSASLDEALRADPHAVRTYEAASVAARLTCDRRAWEQAENRLDLLGREPVDGRHEIVVHPAGLYGEPELGDYQPLDEPSVPDVPQWPLGLIDVPDCGW